MQARNVLLYVVLSFWGAAVSAQNWLFPFPVYIGQISGGEINAYSDGIAISAVSKASILPLLEEFVEPEFVQKVTFIDGDKISIEELSSIGIQLNYDPALLSISMSFDESIAREYTLSFGQEYHTPIYSQAGFLAWHNVFNLSADKQHSEDFETSTWLGEWLSKGNIGGAKGLNFEISSYISGDDGSETSVYRGDALLFIDEPDSPWRLSIGDVTPISAGHLPSVQLGGAAWERLYDEVQPTRNIQNGGTQAIVLNESAELELFINDTFITEFRLPPGRYRLDDLPLSSGSNDIKIEIRYVSGETDTIVYSQFYNTRLLREGISDFGLYAGLVSSIEDDRYRYDDEQGVGAGFFEYGWSDTLTLGTNAMYHPNGYIAGIVTVIGSNFGNFGFRASTIFSDVSEQQGSIFSFDYAHQVWGSDNYGSPNLRLSIEQYTHYLSIPWQENDAESGLSTNLSYIINLTTSTDINFSGNYAHLDESEDEWFASAELSWQYYDWAFSGGVEHEEDPNNGISDTQFLFSVSWDWASTSSDHRANISYNNSTERLRARFQKNTDNVVGDYGYRLTAEGNDTYQQYSGLMNYVGNRFTAEGEYGYTVYDEEANSHHTSLRLSSAVTLVDTNIGWGRPYSGPAAIVKVHDSLDADVYINALAGDEPEGISTSAISNIVGLSVGHVESEVFIDSPQAPVGYDIGLPLRHITPGSQTGHILQVGSEASKTIIGKMVYRDGKPTSLIQGHLESDDHQYEFFTNRSGRFVVEGIAPGHYTVWSGFHSYPIGYVVLEEEEASLIHLPLITLEVDSNENSML